MQTSKRLIKEAWALLRMNLDLVEWSICVGFCGQGFGTKHQDVFDCVRERLGGTKPLLVQVDCIDRYPLGEAPWVFALDMQFPDTIHFFAPATGSHFQDTVEEYCKGGSFGPMCLSVYIASVLLHEMTHTCGVSYLDGGDSECRESYLIDQTFLWAMLMRYPQSLISPCCGLWREDDPNQPAPAGMSLFPVDGLFMSDGNNIAQQHNC